MKTNLPANITYIDSIFSEEKVSSETKACYSVFCCSIHLEQVKANVPLEQVFLVKFSLDNFLCSCVKKNLAIFFLDLNFDTYPCQGRPKKNCQVKINMSRKTCSCGTYGLYGHKFLKTKKSV